MWERCNDMIISWTINAIEPHIANEFMHANSAMELWTDIKERFHMGDGGTHTTQKQYCKLQGSGNVITYYSNMKALWDKLEAYIPLPECTCGSSKILFERREEEKYYLDVIMFFFSFVGSLIQMGIKN